MKAIGILAAVLALARCSSEQAAQEVDKQEQPFLTYYQQNPGSTLFKTVGYEAFVDDTTSRFTRGYMRVSGTRPTDQHTGYGVSIQGRGSSGIAQVHLFVGAVRSSDFLFDDSYESNPDERFCLSASNANQFYCDDTDFHYDSGTPYVNGDSLSASGSYRILLRKISDTWQVWWADTSTGGIDYIGYWDNGDVDKYPITSPPFYDDEYLSGDATRDIAVQFIAFSAYNPQDSGNQADIGSLTFAGMEYALDGGTYYPLGYGTPQDIKLEATGFSVGDLYMGSDVCGTGNVRRPCVTVSD